MCLEDAESRKFPRYPRATALRAFAIASVSLANLLCVAGLSAKTLEPSFAVTITPQMSANRAIFRKLNVQETMVGGTSATDHPLLELPYVVFNVPTLADRVEALKASDDNGALQLTSRDSGQGDARVRQWFGSRTVHGTLHLSYSVPVPVVTAPHGAAPPIDLKGVDGALSGGGATFLLRPAAGKFHLSISWTKGDLPAGDDAFTSLDGLSSDLLDADTLAATYVMAGKVGASEKRTTAKGFRGVWQGAPSFDAASMLTWAGDLYGHYQELFHTGDRPYTVFMRYNAVNPGGGYGLYRSFIITFGVNEANEIDDLKSTLAHEMFHTFQPMIWTPSSTDGALGSAWMDEGMAVFYQITLPYRYRMEGTAEYLREINYYAGRYYTSIFQDLPNTQIPPRFWEDTRIRTLPYDRGFLYFVTVDHAIREKSRGKRSLDDLMLALRAEVDGGHPLTENSWRQVIQAELGSKDTKAWADMLQGKPVLPSSDAFGPCFRRVERPLRRYELGFAPKVLTEQPRIVRGLVAGSNAEKAGLRNGDEITAPVGQDRIQGEQQAKLTLMVKRDGKIFPISYLPRGQTVLAWQWQADSMSSPARCALGGR